MKLGYQIAHSTGLNNRGAAIRQRRICHLMASLKIKVHPHMLRHATGFDLANRGTDTRTLQDYLGHRNIQHTVRYTELTPHRFKDLWSD